MTAFKLLSKRETIMIHCKSKIDKVNEIMMREIKACESFAKSKPS